MAAAPAHVPLGLLTTVNVVITGLGIVDDDEELLELVLLLVGVVRVTDELLVVAPVVGVVGPVVAVVDPVVLALVAVVVARVVAVLVVVARVVAVVARVLDVVDPSLMEVVAGSDVALDVGASVLAEADDVGSEIDGAAGGSVVVISLAAVAVSSPRVNSSSAPTRTRITAAAIPANAWGDRSRPPPGGGS